MTYQPKFIKQKRKLPFMDGELPAGTIACPIDANNLHFEQFQGMRIKSERHDSCGYFYTGLCPLCKRYYKVTARRY